MYKRTGECNLCGECCGFPRITDGGQNNPWPSDWPEVLDSWSEEDKEKSSPIFKITGHIKKHGNFVLDSKVFPWIWVKNKGLCKSDTDYRCPFLGDMTMDAEVPCLLYGTDYHFIWEEYCNLTPPEYFETKNQVENWQKNCPSCSFVYEEVK